MNILVLIGLGVVLYMVGRLVLGGSGKLPPVVAYFGGLGAGKSSWMVHEVLRLSKENPWTPVVSTVPVVLDRPYCLFLARSPGDYIAAAFVFAQWVFSEQAYQISAAAKRGKLRRWMDRRGWRRGLGLSDVEIEKIFKRMQAEYRDIAPRIDWRSRRSIETLIMAHNLRVLSNRLDAPLREVVDDAEAIRQYEVNGWELTLSTGHTAAQAVALAPGDRLLAPSRVDEILESLGAEADEYKAKDFYGRAGHAWGVFRFKYRPPALRFCVLFDEVGVVASADDNQVLKESAFYPFIAQARKLGAVIFATGHHPSRVQKQLREIVNVFCKVYSFDLPRGWGRWYFVRGYETEQHYEEGVKGKYLRLGRVTLDTMSRYATFWIVENWSD